VFVSRLHLSAVFVLLLAEPGAAQLVDLQPGRNFPTAVSAFGGGRTGGIDIADADHDGDLDVAVANGLYAPQANSIFINQGGVQGGVLGSFVDETVTRFAGHPVDRSRDLEFVDYDGDGDLDLFFTNEGNTSNGGGVSRAYSNQGGMQLGSVGFFAEHTDDFWGDLLGVPASQQIFGGDHGPFRDFPCDCSFGDLDLDGDPDLFSSTYGPNINGAYDSRVFLNDGTGTFDELWPWADPAADTKMHVMDVDLADLDADFDLDIFVASRDSQARVFRNDLDVQAMVWPGDPFTDVTHGALLAQGAGLSGNSNYEVELADYDGDGDYDAWMNNYSGFQERLLVNDGTGRFAVAGGAILGDPNLDEEEVDVLDFDGDGDLDVFSGNFSGTNWLYQSSLADQPGLDVQLHRTGTVSGGSQASWFETPTSGNGGTTDAVESGDLDGDGDPDLVLGNDGNQQNRLWENVLGVPDTHAPSVYLLTAQPDKNDGSDTPLRVQLRDNSPQRTIRRYDVDLVYTVDGGLPVRSPMRSQRGSQFQATIPGGVNGSIAWYVEGSDEGGNTFVTAWQGYVQTSAGVTVIETVGSGTPGVAGHPDLLMFGDLSGGSTLSVSFRDGAPNAVSLLFVSLSSTPTPFKGGWLHTVPIVLSIVVPTDPAGSWWLDLIWPTALPSGVQLWNQVGVVDGTASSGASLSNAVQLTAP